MDATHLVAILAVCRVIVAAIGVIGVVVVVIPERTAKIGEPATIATAVIIPAAAITVPIRVAVVAPFAERDGCAAGAVAVGDGSVPGPPPASGVGSTRPVSGCDGIVAAGPSPGEGNLPGPPPASGVGSTRSVAGPCWATATLIAAELARAAIANIPMTGLRLGGLLLIECRARKGTFLVSLTTERQRPFAINVTRTKVKSPWARSRHRER